MGKLSNVSGRETVKAFERAGWTVSGEVGSHVVLTRPGIRVNLSVPQHKELSVDAAGLTVDEFLELL